MFSVVGRKPTLKENKKCSFIMDMKYPSGNPYGIVTQTTWSLVKTILEAIYRHIQ